MTSKIQSSFAAAWSRERPAWLTMSSTTDDARNCAPAVAVAAAATATVAVVASASFVVPNMVMPRGLQSRSNAEAYIAQHGGQLVRLSAGRTWYKIFNRDADASKGPVLVLVHGLSVAEIWHDLAENFAHHTGRTVLIYHNYGRGCSDAPDVKHTGELYTTQLAELLFALDINGKIDLAGVSQGGAIVTMFTTQYPQRVNRLQLHCPAGLKVAMNRVANAARFPVLGELIYRFFMVDGYIKASRNIYENPDSPHSAYQKAIQVWYKTVAEHPGYIRSLLSTLRCFPMSSLEPVIAEMGSGKTFSGNIQIVWGDQDRLVPFENHKRFMELLPSATLVQIKNTRHMFLVDRPQESLEILLRFFS